MTRARIKSCVSCYQPETASGIISSWFIIFEFLLAFHFFAFILVRTSFAAKSCKMNLNVALAALAPSLAPNATRVNSSKHRQTLVLSILLSLRPTIYLKTLPNPERNRSRRTEVHTKSAESFESIPYSEDQDTAMPYSSPTYCLIDHNYNRNCR